MRNTAPCSQHSRATARRCGGSAWIERTLPADADALGSYLLEAKRADATLEDPPDEFVSYLQLIGRAGHVAEEHELLFSLQIDARRPAARRAITRMGGGDLGALAVLAAEVGQLIELLDQAAISVTGLLTRAGVAAAVRAGYDPWGHRQRQRQLEHTPHGRPGDRAAHRHTDRAGRALGAPRSRTVRCIARCGSPSGRGSTCAPCSCSRC